ncbi:MAG: cell division protein SepF [Actinobacteria bacterium]|nr:cell division protein SepF [Actinomycetota bacterium]
MSAFFKKTLSFLGLAEDDSESYYSEDLEQNHQEEYGINGDNYRNDFNPRRNFSFKNYAAREENQKKNTVQERTSRKLLSIDGARDAKKIKVSVTEPHEFEEVQAIGDDLKFNIPVIVNLQNTNPELSKRIIDFCSGLTYALEGSIKKVADRVFLITPKDTVVTSNEKEILRERGLYNQV